jgi:hypothetical protein
MQADAAPAPAAAAAPAAATAEELAAAFAPAVAPGLPPQRPFCAAGCRNGSLHQDQLVSPEAMRSELASELRGVVAYVVMGVRDPSDTRRMEMLAAELWLFTAHHEDWLVWNAVDWVERLRWNYGQGFAWTGPERDAYVKLKTRLRDDMERRFREAGDGARAIVTAQLARP